MSSRICKWCGNESTVIYRDGGSCSYCVGWDWLQCNQGKVFPWNPITKEIDVFYFHGEHASAKFFKDGTCLIHTEKFAEDDIMMRGATIKNDFWVKNMPEISNYDSYKGNEHIILDKETVAELRKPIPYPK